MINEKCDEMIKKLLLAKELLLKSEFEEDVRADLERTLLRDLNYMTELLNINIEWLNKRINIAKGIYE